MHRLLTSLVCGVSMVACAHASAPSPLARTTPVEALSFLAGTWRTEGALLIEEVWTTPAADSMLGIGRTIADGRLASVEYMRIDRRDGVLAFTAQPNGGSPVTFTLVAFDRNEAVFENLAHDFPQRVVYRAEPDGSLLAWIEGPAPEGTKRIEFRYRRVQDVK